MPWILVFETDGKIYTRASVSLSLYNTAKPYAHKKFSDLKILLDRTDIPDTIYEDAYGLVFELVERMNKGEKVDIKGELERLLDES